MNDEELKDLSVDVKEWFQDQVELDCDCMNVESETEGDARHDMHCQYLFSSTIALIDIFADSAFLLY